MARDGAAIKRHIIDTAYALFYKGCNSLVLIHGDTAYAEAARDAAQCLVKQHVLAHRIVHDHRRSIR